MNASVRAHRILSRMDCYFSAKYCDSAEEPIDSLGDLIGCYRNPAPNGKKVWIFAAGLAWGDRGGLIRIPYTEIFEVSADASKLSKELQIETKNGDTYLMPVSGGRGKFSDSMEMLHFLDRVIEDSKKGLS